MTLPGIPDGPAPLAAIQRTAWPAQVAKLKNAIEEGKRRGDLPAALALPACTVTLSGTAQATNNGDKTVAWDGYEENWADASGNPMWSISAPDQVVIRCAGRYRPTATVVWSNPSGSTALAGQRVAYILRNASAPAASASPAIAYNFATVVGMPKPGGGVPVQLVAPELRLAVGDILRVSGFQSQGTDLSYQGNSYGGPMRFTVAYSSP